MTAYAELQVTTNFSFLRGGSHPEELVEQAAVLGMQAIGVTDRNTLSGVVRAHVAAKVAGIKLLVGARLDLQDGPSLLCYPRDRAAYGRLSRLLTLGQRRTGKGQCLLFTDDVIAHAEGQVVVGDLLQVSPLVRAAALDHAALGTDQQFTGIGGIGPGAGVVVRQLLIQRQVHVFLGQVRAFGLLVERAQHRLAAVDRRGRPLQRKAIAAIADFYAQPQFDLAQIAVERAA